MLLSLERTNLVLDSKLTEVTRSPVRETLRFSFLVTVIGLMFGVFEVAVITSSTIDY
jgi:hypothetical protein